MNILFLFVSLPHIKNQHNIFVSLIKEFKQNGHNVFVSAKGYNIDQTKMAIEEGIPVLRIKSRNFTGVKNSVKKALAYQEYTIKQAFYISKFFKGSKFDLIISHSLPPEVAYIACKLKKKFHCPFCLLQTDFTWQDAVAFKYFRENSLVAFYYKYWERLLYENADYIVCPTSGCINFIKRYYPKLPDNKFRLQPLWQTPLPIFNDLKSDIVKKKYNLLNRFVVVYGGSIGIAQRAEHMIDLAEACISYNDIVFVILGRGNGIEKLKSITKNKKLLNVKFIDFMPQDDYLKFLSSCDVGMILLNERMATPNFPSKALSYFNMKVPILAAVDYVTDFGQFLEANNSGLWGYSDNIDMLKSKLLKYYNSRDYCDYVRENGYNLFINKLTPEQSYKNIISFIN